MGSGLPVLTIHQLLRLLDSRRPGFERHKSYLTAANPKRTADSSGKVEARRRSHADILLKADILYKQWAWAVESLMIGGKPCSTEPVLHAFFHACAILSASSPAKVKKEELQTICGADSKEKCDIV